MTPGPAELDNVPGTAFDHQLDHELERILATGAVRSLYQPIVDLATGEQVGSSSTSRPVSCHASRPPDPAL